MNFLKRLLGATPNNNLKEFLQNGAILIDVRSESEFAEKHSADAQNIPLPEIAKASGYLDKSKTYILVCASGLRSRIATSMLKKKGFDNVYNGGRWTSFE